MIMRFGVALLSLALAGGCGGAKGGGSDDKPPANADFEALNADLQEYVQAMCDFESRCWDYDQADCMSWFVRDVCGPDYAKVALPELAACAEALSTLDCEENPYQAVACLPVRNAIQTVRGSRLVGEGEACNETENTWCDGGLFCDADSGQCGACKKQVALGARCRPDGWNECDSRSGYCSDEGVCTKYKEKGEKCGAYDECGGYGCYLGTCQDFLDLVGLACETSEDCDHQFACLEGKCAARKPLAEACSEDLECETLACFEGKCTEPATCGRGVEGQSCWQDSDCTAGLRCDWNSQTCAKPLADGELGCASGELRCGSKSYCKFDGSLVSDDGNGDNAYVCAAKLSDGKACESSGPNDECLSGFCNDDLKCAKKPELVCE
jgi:hypothetical protein